MTRSPSKYETTGGTVSRADTSMKILDLLDQILDQTAVMAHLHNTEGNDMDKLLAKGWLGMHEMFKLIRWQLLEMAKGKIIKDLRRGS